MRCESVDSDVFGGMRESLCRHVKIFASQSGQDTVEYALVVGVMVFALVSGFLGFSLVVEQVLRMLCPSIDTATGIAATVGSCIT